MRKANHFKMIVTDLDGTLLRNDKTISPYTIKTIAKLRQSGHKFVVATARPLRAAKKFLESMEIDAGIYHNGALLYRGKNKIDSYQIDHAHDVIHSILNLNPSAFVAAEVDDILYSNFAAERLWPGTDYTLTQSDFSEICGKKADKIIVEVNSLEDMEKYKSVLTDDLYIQISENIIGMIMKKAAAKSNGIQYLASEFGIGTENIIAFGDDYNDIDMLQTAGIGICVKNGLDIVKNHADAICGSKEEDGVAKWLEKNM